MKTVLLAWELGGGLGHIGRLQAIAKVLTTKGYQPVFVIRNLNEANALLNNTAWRIYQAPVFMKHTRRGFAAASHADLLMNNGFAKAAELLPQVSAWQTFIETFNPSLIIADHSPTLCLAARGMVPVVSIGTGFTLPPVDTHEFPRLRDDVPVTAPQSHLLEVIREVQKLRRMPCPETVTGIMDTERRLLCTLPELDPYQSIREEPGIGPIGELPQYKPVPLEPGLFIYITSDYAALDILGLCMADLDIPVHAYIRGDSGVIANFLDRRGVTIYREPPKLADILPRVSAILHHGGNFTTHAALVAGRPQLIVPRYYEAALNGRLLESLGVGINMEKMITMEELKKALRKVLYEPDISGESAKLAISIHQREPLEGLKTAVDTCLEFLT